MQTCHNHVIKGEIELPAATHPRACLHAAQVACLCGSHTLPPCLRDGSRAEAPPVSCRPQRLIQSTSKRFSPEPPAARQQRESNARCSGDALQKRICTCLSPEG